MTQKKIAIILFNLGGPDSKESIRPFLFNFFTDKNIIRLPYPARAAIAWLIARNRTKKEAGDSYALLGYKSPLLENSQRQGAALEALLNQDGTAIYKSFVCMRYWHPMADEIAAQVADFAPDHIVLLPLYPQYSTTTTRSSLQEWKKAAKNLHVPTSMVCCYPEDPGFIAASAARVREAYERALHECGRTPRVLFSAHGLPEDIITDGDPYQNQCEAGARAIALALNIPDLDWAICYQSRVGPKTWIGPSTTEEILRAAADNMPLIIYPHAFVNEHVETLVEIEIEYRHLADEASVPYFARVPTVDTHEDFIAGLARAVRDAQTRTTITPAPGHAVCGNDFKRCCITDETLCCNKKGCGA